MKKYLLLFASAALLLVGCAKEQLSNGVEGGMTEVTFTASLDNGVATKADADNDGDGTNVNRCIMEIYFQNQFYKRMVQSVTPAAENVKAYATFSNVPVVAGKQYQILFWADCGGAENADKYYTTNTTNKGLTEVAIKHDAFINALENSKNDELDAFFAADNYTVPQAGGNFSITLHRPFAQMNVITTDVASGKTVISADLLPETVTVSYTAATTFNVADNTATGSAAYTYTAPVYGDNTNWSAVKTRGEFTLSMDYILADKEQRLVNVAFSTSTGMSHDLNNLPYQRNYRTNVKGDLLTTGGTWKATIDPIWGGEINEEGVVTVHTYQTAQGAVSDNNFTKIIVTPDVVEDYWAIRNEAAAHEQDEVEALPLTDYEKTALRTREEADGKKYIMFVLKTTSPITEAFELPSPDAGGEDNYGWYIYHETGYPTVTLDVTPAAGLEDLDIVIDAPETSAIVNGVAYNSITAITADHTLIIDENVTIKERLNIKQGNVVCYGTIANDCQVTLAEGSKFYYGIRSDASLSHYKSALNRLIGMDGGANSKVGIMVGEGTITGGPQISIRRETEVYGIEGETLHGGAMFASFSPLTIISGSFASDITFAYAGATITFDGGYFASGVSVLAGDYSVGIPLSGTVYVIKDVMCKGNFYSQIWDSSGEYLNRCSVSGGDFNSFKEFAFCSHYITGGIFDKKPSQSCLAEHFSANAITDQGRTRYVVGKDTPLAYRRDSNSQAFYEVWGSTLYNAINDAYFESLQNDGKYHFGATVKLNMDLSGNAASVQMAHSAGSPAYADWYFDLNGHKLTASTSCNSFAEAGESSSALLWFQGWGASSPCSNVVTIKDSGVGGKVENTYSGADAYSAAISIGARTLNNGYGKLTIESGTFKAVKDAIYTEGGHLVITGGNFVGANAIKARTFDGSATSLLNIEISGGLFEGNIDLANKAENPVADNNKCHATITGGTFEGSFMIGTNVEISISGGKFKVKPDASYLVEGATCSEETDADGYYIVTPNN